MKNKFLIGALFSLTAVCVACAAAPFMKLVVVLGHNIPQKDMWLDYCMGAGWAFFLGLTIRFWPVRDDDKRPLLIAWVIKSLVILGPMLVYEDRYLMDSYGFFGQIKDLGPLLPYIAMMESNLPVTLVSAFHRFFLYSFHAATISFGMIGLIGIYIFYRAAVLFLTREKIRLFYLLTFFPSILFWSSIYGKDPVVLFFISLNVYGVVCWARSGKKLMPLVMLAGAALAAIVRIWMGVILGIPALFAVFSTGRRRPAERAAYAAALVAIILFNSFRVMNSFGLKSTKDITKVANMKYIHFSVGGSSAVQPAVETEPFESGTPVSSASTEVSAKAKELPAAAETEPFESGTPVSSASTEVSAKAKELPASYTPVRAQQRQNEQSVRTIIAKNTSGVFQQEPPALAKPEEAVAVKKEDSNPAEHDFIAPLVMRPQEPPALVKPEVAVAVKKEDMNPAEHDFIAPLVGRPHKLSLPFEMVPHKYKGLTQVILAMPQGIFTVLFRPFPGEVRNVFGFLAGMEGSVLLVLFVFAAIRARREKQRDPLIMWGLLLIFTWAVFYSFVGFNMGTVSRYRLQILPLFISIMLYFFYNKPVGRKDR